MTSLDQTAHLRQAFRELMVAVTGIRLASDGTGWWLVPCVLLSLGIGYWLAVDMRPCRLAMAALAVVAFSYLAAAAIRFEWVTIEDRLRRTMIEQGALFFGSLFMLLTIGLYARHVLLDARGLLPQRCHKSAAPGPTVADPRLVADLREIPASEQGSRGVSVYPASVTPVRTLDHDRVSWPAGQTCQQPANFDRRPDR